MSGLASVNFLINASPKAGPVPPSWVRKVISVWPPPDPESPPMLPTAQPVRARERAAIEVAARVVIRRRDVDTTYLLVSVVPDGVEILKRFIDCG
jgi:hypothetical protein